jgi:signal transduction histidine kinase/CheY-like chemotaxis protein
MSDARSAPTPPELPIISLSLRNEADVVLVRQRARLISELLGFGTVDQTRNATAVSEIARNAIQHGGVGRIRFSISGTTPRGLRITVEDSGIQPSARFGGPREKRRGGVGVELSRRLMDSFELREREQGGTVVEMVKRLPPDRRTTGAAEVRRIVGELLRRPPESLIEELHQQQQELLSVLEDLTSQQERLRTVNLELEETNRGVMALYAQVTQELDDTNRGVMALYAQLDDQARELQRANALKDRFLSHLSHEFRTPLNSTLALAGLLLDRADGPLSEEQERQVGFIHGGARELLSMVNDLLDLAKIEAGRLDTNPETFSVDELFSALRGMFRPLAAEKDVELTFTEADADFPLLRTDQQKVSRILRNLISNSLKFTEEGEIRVSAREDGADTIVFEVQDTGIGIPSDQMARIFREFEQVAGPHQRTVQGTGLGLPLSVQLAALLGGSIEAESTVNRGSTFRLRIPRSIATIDEAPAAPAPRKPDRSSLPIAARTTRPHPTPPSDGSGPFVLVVDEEPSTRYLVEHMIAASGFTVVHATSAKEALERQRHSRPDAIFLDLGISDRSGFDLLRSLASDPESGGRPIITYTSRHLPDTETQLYTGFALRVVSRDDPSIQALGSIGAALLRATVQRGEERARND